MSTLATAQGPMHRWHGGVHLQGGGEPVRAIADGTVVACRFATQPETYEPYGAYDTSFVLLRHETQTGENTTVVFYSLYMHLANQSALAADRLSQLPSWLRQSPGPTARRPANQRVWRKDVLGFAGQLYNREAMHFEVFMLDADFRRVWRDSSSIAQGNGSDDWFGDAHFVIPAQQRFAERHPRAATGGDHRIDFSPGNFPLALGQAGHNDQTLYVSASLQQGRRITKTYRARSDGSFEQVGTAVVQEDYEYELYRLATALYPDCPSAGLEWLRFGRVLGPDRTTRNENWQLVRYSESAIGYIDLGPDAIAKLSDADFPHWLGWDKRDEGSTANARDGICDDELTLELVQRAQGDDNVKRKLQHLICKAPTEWDDSYLATRYACFREPGQPLESAENWQLFTEHASKLAFWGSSGLSERSFWHFHPLRFIRHFRKCGWLSGTEFTQCLPRQLQHLQQTTFHAATVSWATALASATRWNTSFCKVTRKYGLHLPKRRVHFLSHIIPETGYMRLVVEGDGQYKPYAPYFGRGLIQLTHLETYKAYGKFRGFPATATAGVFAQLGWDPRERIANTSTDFNAENCADSAGFYVVQKNNMLRHMDSGLGQNEGIVVSKDVNGYVAHIEDLNGLDARLQCLILIPNHLLDSTETRSSVSLIFEWRRNSQREPKLNEQGNVVMAGNPPHPKMIFYPTTHNISVPLLKQRP
ncbi:MAG: M23 family metallopeptidase [Burkholderiaceae bacterium]